MTPKEKARERRAADRERRRTNGTTEEEPRSERSSHVSRDAMRLVAAAAARGAAQAIAERRRHVDDEGSDIDEGFDTDPVSEATDAPPDIDDLFDLEDEPTSEPEPEPEPEPVSPSGLQSLVRSARDVLVELHGADAESVSSVSKSAHGWTVGLEVVELRRVPESMDVLATYEVELDDDGQVLRYERVGRYKRADGERRHE